MRRRGKKCRDTVIDRSPPIKLLTRFHSRGAFQATRGMFGNRRRNVNGENLRILYCSQFFQFQRTNQPRWTMNSSTSNERILLYLALFYVFVPRLSRRCSPCSVIEIAPSLWNRIDKKKERRVTEDRAESQHWTKLETSVSRWLDTRQKVRNSL